MSDAAVIVLAVALAGAVIALLVQVEARITAERKSHASDLRADEAIDARDEAKASEKKKDTELGAEKTVHEATLRALTAAREELKEHAAKELAGASDDALATVVDGMLEKRQADMSRRTAATGADRRKDGSAAVPGPGTATGSGAAGKPRGP